ncbi:MAG: hypothetical protein E4H01_11260 [Lysobacterales bacterium]|nr:MAG: hypothetical protein E4H01_11260 [Xanthomonadales bacterium]
MADVGPEGGALWISPPDHMTLLAIPMDAFSVTEVITLSYSRQSNPQGDLQGMNHFFRLGTAQDGPGIYASQVLSTPARIVLAYRGSGGLVKDTIGLYQATASGWITDGITTVAQLPGYLVHCPC